MASRDALWELSERQWHTHSILDQNIKDQIEEWIIQNWSGSYTEKYVQFIAGISGMLGLTKSYSFLRSLLKNDQIPNNIKKELENLIAEYGDSVENPFKN